MIVGIDLGTSTSEVAFLKKGRPTLIREVAGAVHGILPSVVGIHTDGTARVGEAAAKSLIASPARTVAEIKRKMGSDERIRLGAEEFTPQEISARILGHLKREAEKYLGEPVTEAVITVPAYFTDRQRRATKDAAEIAGLRCRRLINEPTAAALAYGIEQPGVEEKILVYDLGGGTLDVTVLELSEGYLDVLASTGNSSLGGKDFDERLMTLLRQRCQNKTGIDAFAASADKIRLRNVQKFKAAAKRAKEELSSAETAHIVIDSVGNDAEGDPVDFEEVVTRADFDDLVRDLVESSRTHLDEALAAKNLSTGEIDRVLMIGGSTRMPLVRQFVSDYFGGMVLRTEISPDEAVALGAAVLSGIEARLIDPEDMVITDVCSHTFGIESLAETGDGREAVFTPVIAKNTTIPRTAKETFYTTVDFQEAVHVRVFQGDSQYCRDNAPVGDFVHALSEPRPEGQPIEIEMSYNLDGIVDVVARDWSGEETAVRLMPEASVMSEAEKRAAQTRMARDGAPSTESARPGPDSPGTVESGNWEDSPLYPRVAALISHAEGRLEELTGADRLRVNQLLNELKARLVANDPGGTTSAEQTLIDVLFELD